MWHRAAKWVAKFPEAVITAICTDGYPVSVRQGSLCYDAGTGEMPVVIPDELRATPGPANVLAHRHDENLWRLNAIQIKGRLERRGDEWVFISTSFTPPGGSEIIRLWQLARTLSRAANRYLKKRGLARPPVNWTAIDMLQRQARASRDRKLPPSQPR